MLVAEEEEGIKSEGSFNENDNPDTVAFANANNDLVILNNFELLILLPLEYYYIFISCQGVRTYTVAARCEVVKLGSNRSFHWKLPIEASIGTRMNRNE